MHYLSAVGSFVTGRSPSELIEDRCEVSISSDALRTQGQLSGSVSLYASHRSEEPLAARPITVPRVFPHTLIGCQITYAQAGRQEPFMARPKRPAGAFPHASERNAQPCRTGDLCNYLLQGMLNDLVPTRPERDDLFDPGLCGIQVRRSLQPNRSPLIFSSEDIVPGRFHGSPSDQITGHGLATIDSIVYKLRGFT